MTMPEKVGLSSERLARIRPAVQRSVGNDKLPGVLTLLARSGEVVHLECMGVMDRENSRPMQQDTIFRIHSMTKPIIAVGLMMLYEQGCFQLFDPVAKFIPAFKALKVFAGEDESRVKLVNLERPVTIRHLLTHTSGLTYHHLEYGPVERKYRDARVSSEKPLPEFVADLVKLPLAFQPGTRWRYSFAYDVAAYLIEIVSGRSLDEYLHDAVFAPLGMLDTGFGVLPEKLDRLAPEYGSYHYLQPDVTLSRWYADAASSTNQVILKPADSLEGTMRKVLRGGDGLVSTAQDYLRFCQMLLDNGQLDGRHLLGRKTVELMTTNHLAPQFLPFEFGGNYWGGYGYGLGVRVLMDVGQVERLGSIGEYGWLGAAGTYFWVDPKEQLIGIHMAQFQPGGFFSSYLDFRTLAYQSIVD